MDLSLMPICSIIRDQDRLLGPTLMIGKALSSKHLKTSSVVTKSLTLMGKNATPDSFSIMALSILIMMPMSSL